MDQENSKLDPNETDLAAKTQPDDREQPQEWNEDQSALFVCRMCSKTFYNRIALQNHENLHHAATNENRSKSERGDAHEYIATEDVDDLYTFKFLPLKKEIEDETIRHEDGLVSRVFSEDTTYIVVKLESEQAEVEAAKRRRLEGVVRRAQMRPEKPPIDLRGPFTCTFPMVMRPELQCRQIFFNCCEYSLHYREEHTKRRKAALRCQVCERRLDRDLPTPAHSPAPSRPPALLTFSCRMCGLIFLSGVEYDDHNRQLHAKMKPHQCSLCAKRFTQQGGLQQHMRMHTGIRPFGCTYCPKAFTQKAGLDQHMRTHTKIKPFKCVICMKGFSQSVHLRQHMRTHTNIQPFECSECGKRFKQTSHLNFHLRTHGGGGGEGGGCATPATNAPGDPGLFYSEYLHPMPSSAVPFAYQLQLQPSFENYILNYNIDS